MKLRAPLRVDSEIDGRLVLAPIPFVRVGYQEHWSEVSDGVVDTGSPITLISSSIARDLGYPVEEEAKLREFRSFKVGGREVNAFQAHLDLAILRTSSDQVGMGLVLRNCVVFLFDETAAAEPSSRSDQRPNTDQSAPIIVLGQHDVLERLGFEQHNQEPVFDFVLDEIP